MFTVICLFQTMKYRSFQNARIARPMVNKWLINSSLVFQRKGKVNFFDVVSNRVPGTSFRPLFDEYLTVLGAAGDTGVPAIQLPYLCFFFLNSCYIHDTFLDQTSTLKHCNVLFVCDLSYAVLLFRDHPPLPLHGPSKINRRVFLWKCGGGGAELTITPRDNFRMFC